MALRSMLDDIELQQVQRIDSDQDQLLVRHAVPALEGDFLQGLGRRAGAFVLDGVLTGPEVADGLTSLREKFHAAEPVSFTADIATATRIDQVLIEAMDVREIAGHALRFEYSFLLREFIPPPAPRRETPPPPPPPQEVENGILEVEVIVDGQPEFDHDATVVTVEGTKADGAPLGARTLSNRANNLWTETEFPPGSYTCRARVEQPQVMTGSAQAAVQPGQTTRAVIRLRPGAQIAKAFVVHFWFDKAFIEPCLRAVLRQVAAYASAHPDEKLVIVGHTDLVGGEGYNQSLSERRSRSVYAWLTAGRDMAASRAEWEALRRTRPAGEEPSIKDSWATREYQFMLNALEFYQASIDEDHGPLTTAAVRAFQLDNGLPQTGTVDDATWSALIAAYLAQDRLAVAESQFLPNAGNSCSNGIVKWLGCGEKDPVLNTRDAWRPNRRTELLFVRASEFPCEIPKPVTFDLPGPGGDWCLGPGDPNQRCCFLTRGSEQEGRWQVAPAESGQVTVSGAVTLPDGTPVANEAYALMDPTGKYLHTNAAGQVDLGERPSGPQRGRPIPNRTAADGRFSYPDPRPVGTYILHLLELQAPSVARWADEAPQSARGNFICRRLPAGTGDLPAVIEPGPTPAVTVNPTLTLAATLVLVKKSYTSPARVRVTLGTSAPFNRTGTLTRSGNAVRLFTAASGGSEITFNGTDNVFTGAQLSAGLPLFAEGASASASMNDVQLTLTLVAGSTPIGPPAVATLTAVELTLDIAERRTAPGVTPPPLPQPPDPPPASGATDKWFGGRLINVQNAQSVQERAMLIVRAVRPADFAGTLVLRQVSVSGNTVGAPANRLRVFDNETPTAGETAKLNPHEIAVGTIPAGGLELFVEGRNSSASLRDVGFQLGIKDGEPDGDRVAVTVGVTAFVILAAAVVVVKKPHTNPARRQVTLRTNTAFARNGALTRSSNGVRFFTAASAGTEITFNGADNVFSGAQLTAGVQLFAEGATASTNLNDFLLTLTLAAGAAPPAGLPTTARMTAVELTLEVALSRTAAAVDPPLMNAVQKINPGRFVQVRDPGFSHERALLIVRPPQPAAFVGTLVLETLDTPNPRVQLFATEGPAAADPVTATPHTILTGIIPAAGARFFVEARTFSAAARDTGFRLGIQGVEPDGDRVNMTAVQLEVAEQATAAAAALTFTRVGLWDSGYDAAGAIVNLQAEANNFVGADRRKFHFRVHDPVANGSLALNWKTLRSDRSTDDDAPASEVLTLPETAVGSQVFISRGVMLVTDDTDRDFATHSGLVAPFDTGLRNVGQSNHRTRRTLIDGFVRGEYSPSPGVRLPLIVPVFNRNPEERRRLATRVIRYTNVANPLFATATPAYIAGQFLNANRRWNQIGLQVDAGATTDRAVPAAALDGTGVYGGSADNANEQAALNDLIPVTPDNTVTVVFVPLSGANAYATIAQRAAVALGNRYFIFINTTLSFDDETLAHELAHVLFNRFDTATDRRFFTLNTNSPTTLVQGTGIVLPDVRIYRRIQNLHTANPDNDPNNDNVINWARRARAARFPIAAGITAATVTTGNNLTQIF